MKAAIYKITLPDGKCYIGQTTKHIFERFGSHLMDCSRNTHSVKAIQTSYNNGEVDDWQWEVMEIVDDKNVDKEYVNLLEQLYIRVTDNTLNKTHFSTLKDYELLKQYRNKKSKQYYRNIKENNIVKYNKLLRRTNLRDIKIRLLKYIKEGNVKMVEKNVRRYKKRCEEMQ